MSTMSTFYAQAEFALVQCKSCEVVQVLVGVHAVAMVFELLIGTDADCAALFAAEKVI